MSPLRPRHRSGFRLETRWRVLAVLADDLAGALQLARQALVRADNLVECIGDFCRRARSGRLRDGRRNPAVAHRLAKPAGACAGRGWLPRRFPFHSTSKHGARELAFPSTDSGEKVRIRMRRNLTAERRRSDRFASGTGPDYSALPRRDSRFRPFGRSPCDYQTPRIGFLCDSTQRAGT